MPCWLFDYMIICIFSFTMVSIQESMDMMFLPQWSLKEWHLFQLTSSKLNMWCVQSSVSCLFGFKTFSCNLVWNPNNQNTQYLILFFMIQCPFICSFQSSSFFYQSSSFLKQDIDLLQPHMAIWQATSCQLCQLRLNHPY